MCITTTYYVLLDLLYIYCSKNINRNRATILDCSTITLNWLTEVLWKPLSVCILSLTVILLEWISVKYFRLSYDGCINDWITSCHSWLSTLALHPVFPTTFFLSFSLFPLHFSLNLITSSYIHLPTPTSCSLYFLHPIFLFFFHPFNLPFSSLSISVRIIFPQADPPAPHCIKSC